jgi:hypothetical protein
VTLAPERRSAAIDLVVALDRFLEADARRRKLRSTARLEAGLERAIARAFRRQGAVFLRRLGPIRHRFAVAEGRSVRNLAEAIREEDWLPYFDAAELETLELFTGPLRTFAERALTAGARAAIADLTLHSSFDLKSPDAIAYLDHHAAERVAGINDATRSQIATIIRNGVEAGKSYSQVAREIKGRFSQFAVGSPIEHLSSRAELVAVTEIADGYEAGNRLIADRLVSAGLTMQKSWLDVGDKREDERCRSNAAAGWIPIDAAFPSGADRPPDHPACRCACLYQRAPTEA